MVYEEKGNTIADTTDYLEKGGMRFIPLKWPNGSFPLKATLGVLSTVKDVDFSVDYTCNIDVVQRYYKLDDGGFYFFYRPIDINNPFPNRDDSMN